eukprot:3810754-Pleurochrysis_carterae.AAC.1
MKARCSCVRVHTSERVCAEKFALLWLCMQTSAAAVCLRVHAGAMRKSMQMRSNRMHVCASSATSGCMYMHKHKSASMRKKSSAAAASGCT